MGVVDRFSAPPPVPFSHNRRRFFGFDCDGGPLVLECDGSGSKWYNGCNLNKVERWFVIAHCRELNLEDMKTKWPTMKRSMPDVQNIVSTLGPAIFCHMLEVILGDDDCCEISRARIGRYSLICDKMSSELKKKKNSWHTCPVAFRNIYSAEVDHRVQDMFAIDELTAIGNENKETIANRALREVDDTNLRADWSQLLREYLTPMIPVEGMQLGTFSLLVRMMRAAASKESLSATALPGLLKEAQQMCEEKVLLVINISPPYTETV